MQIYRRGKMGKHCASVFCTTLILALITQVWLFPETTTATLTKIDKVVVLKSKRLLMLYENGEIIKSYKIALGRNPEGRKTRAGDMRTPEGLYYLDRRNANSRFHRALHISYPNADDIRYARERGLSTGRDVMIHGLPNGYEDVGKWHRTYDWTKGCIAVTNPEIEEIWALVPDGTPIQIEP